MKKLMFLPLAFSLLLLGCSKNSLTDGWTIEGRIVQSDRQVPEVTTGLPGIPVYLLNLEAVRDTATGWFQPTDLLDSTLSDADGYYRFSAVTPGDCRILPRDTSGRYSFSWSSGPDSMWILKNNKKSSFTVNFKTPEPQEDNLTYNFYLRIQYGSDYPKDAFLGGMMRTRPKFELYRLTQTWDIVGWYSKWGIPYAPKFGWGDWYWKQVSSSELSYYHTGWRQLVFNEPVDASNDIYHYKDQFRIKIRYNHYDDADFGESWLEESTEMKTIDGLTFYYQGYAFNFDLTLNKNSIKVE